MTLRALRDLFQRHRDRATGHWKLAGEGGRTLFLESGDVVFAASGRPQDRITSLLVERGKVTQVQLDYALANLKPGLSIGRNLIDMGYITQRDLLDVARLQVERVVHGVMVVRDESPEFESRELDTGTVRLPLDTPQLLFNGLLELQDREGLLELLGPLNQVVVLEGQKYLALSLPSDLAKLPPYFDGTRTLLELGREVAVEPVRLGAFALFLRELGWARLHELPPLDRSALDQVLAPEALPLSEALPGPVDPELPNLFAAIRDAERPTTNLEHLSQSLDEALAEVPRVEPVVIPPVVLPFEVAAPQGERFEVPAVEEGQVSMPTPAFELPEFEPEAAIEDEEPPLTLRQEPYRLEDDEALCEGATARLVPPREPGRPWWILSLLGLLVLGGGSAYLWLRKPATPGPVPQPPPAAIAPQPQVPVSPKPEEAKPELAPQPEVAKADPSVKAAAKPVMDTRTSGSLDAIRKGALEDAVHLGERVAKEHASQICIRLLLATQVPTVQQAPTHFEEAQPPLFLLPFRFRDGRKSYQVMLGPFPDRAAAEARLRSLPQAFRAGGNKPLLFIVAEVPRKQ